MKMLKNIRPNEENDEIQKGPYHLTAPKIETPLDMFFFLPGVHQ